MKRKVQVLNGKMFEIEIEMEQTIEEMKEIIEHEEGYFQEDQRLMHKGKGLAEYQCTLSDYLINEESTVYLIMRARPVPQ